MKKRQVFIGIIVLILVAVFANHLSTRNSNLPLFLITGLMLGYVFTRSRYGFAGSVRKVYFTGNGGLTKALILMFALTIIATAGIHLGAALKGGVPAFRAGEGDLVIPGSGFVAKASLNTIIGGIIFGIGMIFGGCCASGTLTDVGEGELRAWIVVPFFGVGGIIGALHGSWWSESVFQSIGTRLYFPDVFGYLGTVILYLILFLLLYIFVRKYEEKRKREGTYKEEVYEDWQKPLEKKGGFSFFSKETYHKMFVERWSFATGAFLTALIFVFIINTTGSSWGASGPYSLWTTWLVEKFGISFSSPALEGFSNTVGNGLMNHAVSIRNIGMILGALIAMLLAGNFKFNFKISLKEGIFSALGGILMGYGARVAGGCNAGALYSGIANFSLSGWFFLVAMVIGGLIGSKLYLSIFAPSRGIEIEKEEG